jgi:large subunit ribosomal protein L25
MSTFEIIAEARAEAEQGKGASRRLRRLANKTPAIIYGAGKEPTPITLIHKDLWKMQENEAFYSSILSITVDGGDKELVVVKSFQRHPAKDLVMHADFLRVDPAVKINVNIPLHFTNEEACYGARMQGGSITHNAKNVELRCLPGNLPAFIEVDMANIKAGQIIHISDLKLPEGVESVALALGADHDLALAQVVAPKGVKE